MASSLRTLLLTAVVGVFSGGTPKVTIQGPPTFAATGTENLTLTCQVTGMSGSLDFTWSGVCFSNTNTCTIQPKPQQNGDLAICTATERNSTNASTGNYTLNLTFPPQSCNLEDTDHTLTKSGLSISLLSNPVPDCFNFSSGHDEQFAMPTTQLDPLFNVTCTAVNMTHVHCELRQRNMSTDSRGPYNLTISNDLGNCTVSFNVGSNVFPPPDDASLGWLALLVLVALIIAGFFFRKRINMVWRNVLNRGEGRSRDREREELQGSGI